MTTEDDEAHAFCVTAQQYEDVRRPLASLVAAWNDCTPPADLEAHLTPLFARAKHALSAEGSSQSQPAWGQIREALLTELAGCAPAMAVTAATDAVIALIAQPDREPLARCVTRPRPAPTVVPAVESYLDAIVPCPPGTAVRIEVDT